jgi:Asp-tRNA(Asn)/Glu-tRNA(Gln) amidotransferase A subunit family amidase
MGGASSSLLNLWGPLKPKRLPKTLRLFRAIDRTVFQKHYDCLITPTVATTRIAADFDPTKDSLVVSQAPVDPYAGWHLASLFSLLNWMPVINVPTGLAGNGVPTGIQIAARPFEDIVAMELATFCAGAIDRLPYARRAPGCE